MIRKEAVEIIAKSVGKNPIVSANGFMSRDLFEVNELIELEKLDKDKELTETEKKKKTEW